MIWLKLSHLEGVPKPSCYFRLLFLARSLPFILRAGSCDLLDSNPFYICSLGEGRNKTQKTIQYYHLWSIYAVSSTELYLIYIIYSSPQSWKDDIIPMLQMRTMRFKQFWVPWLVSDGGWTEPKSVCSSYTPKAKTWDHLHSSLDSVHLPGFYLLQFIFW